MITRRRLLAVATSGLAATAGCTSGSETEGPGTPTPSGSATAERTDFPTTDEDPTETDGTDDLQPWEPAWTLDVERAHVLGIDAGEERLFLTLSEEGGPSAVASLGQDARSIDWRLSMEGEAVTGNPDSPRDHRDKWGVGVDEGTVYTVHGRDDAYEWTTLHAIDAATGDRRWTFQRERSLAFQGVHDGTVLATGREFFEPEHSHDTPDEPLRTILYGLDPASGDPRWTRPFDGVRDVAIGEIGPVVATEQGATAVGVDGTVQWEREHEGDFEAIATLGELSVVATAPTGSDDTSVAAIGPVGDEQWSIALPVESLTAHAGRAYAFGDHVAAIEPDGSVAWRATRHGDEPTFSPDGDRLYTRAGLRADAVDAYDLPSGRRPFRFDAPSNNAWPVAATDDTLIAQAITPDEAEFTSLFAVDAASGEPRAVYRPDAHVFDAQAVGGTVYVGLGDATVATLEPDS